MPCLCFCRARHRFGVSRLTSASMWCAQLLARVHVLDELIYRRSKHILNAQVSIRAPCCQRWFDCPECHAEKEDHRLRRTTEMVFVCKKCKKAFRKDMTVYEESDEYCPHCDNHYVRRLRRWHRGLADAMTQVIEAKSRQQVVAVETEDFRMDARYAASSRLTHLTIIPARPAG